MIVYNLYILLFQIVGSIPLFIFFRSKVKWSKFVSFFSTIIVSFVLLSMFIFINHYYISTWIRSQKFDYKEWNYNPNNRYRMVKDIKESNLLIGKSKKEVISILGNDFEDGSYLCLGYSTNDPDQGLFFSLDHEVMVVAFDETGKVISVDINYW